MARPSARRRTPAAAGPLRGARLGPHAAAVGRRLARLAADRFAARLFDSDPTLWSADPAVRRSIRKRLGWLRSAERMLGEVGALERFAAGVRQAGTRHVVLLGMGGSSLCPEVLRRVFGPAPGHPDLLVLDSTVPSAVRRVEAAIDPARTLFLVSSKSGTTSETLALQAYFWARLRRLRGAGAPRQFAAITDPGTPLAGQAAARRYLAVFRNPEDIGGRFSALSYFGLVPAALLGIDLRALLSRAVAMQRRCGAGPPPSGNPGVALGAALGELARAGRDKLVLLVDPGLDGFELWIEQLLAESTGKAGKGIVPVPGGAPRRALDGAAGAASALRGADRAGVGIVLGGSAEDRAVAAATAPGRHGAPLLSVRLEDRLDLGAAMLQWEVATAVAGAILGINPFDEPDVAEAKAATEAILAARSRTTPGPAAAGRAGAGGATPGRAAGPAGGAAPGAPPDKGAIARFLRRARRGDHLAFVAYADPFDAGLERLLRRARDRMAAAVPVPVTFGYGPRYLHSTGQLHKGGPASVLVLMLVPNDPERLAIPDRPYDFEALKQAQALGDLRALEARGRRVLRVGQADGARAAAAALLRSLPSGRRR
jgi:glucose-6-phosphate isomerase